MTRIALIAFCAALSVNCARPASTPSTDGNAADSYVTKREFDRVQMRLESLEQSMTALLAMKKTVDELQELAREAAERERNAVPRRPPGPDPEAVYAVPIDDSPFVGPANAPVTIVKAFEFACPFCDRVRPTLDELQKRYGKDVRIVYKHFIVHPQTATVPAHAACAAAEQGKFAEMYELIFSKGFQNERDLSRKNMLAIARGLKLKMKKFEKDMDSADCKERVIGDQALLATLGMRGTPSFYINGRFLAGAQPLDRFEALIDEELAKAKAAIKSGTQADDYYEQVVASGKREL